MLRLRRRLALLLPLVGLSVIYLTAVNHDVSQAMGKAAKKEEEDTMFVEEKDMQGLLQTYIESKRKRRVFDLPKNIKPSHSNEAALKFKSKQNESSHSLAQYFVEEFGLERVDEEVILNPAFSVSRSCEGDCADLQTVLSHWPPSRPTAAFYYLTQTPRLQWLKKSLQFLDENFNNQHHYPVIIFHEEDLLPAREDIRKFTNSTVFFQEITFNLPDFLTKSIHFNIPCLSTISYRKMCRFHAKEVYEYPIMQNLDYLFRLDDDSFLTRPIHYDVFEHMRTHDIEYGYIWPHYDAMSCTEGLWEATGHFINISGIQPHFFNEWTRPKLYYNNFEISSTKIWLSSQYKAYINYVDRLGGMFYHRWGDAPIKSLAVSMFVPQNKTHLFKDIGYAHNSFQN